MLTVKINKEMNNYHCSVYQYGKFTGNGAVCYTREQAEKYKEQVLANGTPDLSVPSPAPAEEKAEDSAGQEGTDPSIEMEDDGQMSFV